MRTLRGGRPARREPVEVAEAAKPDRQLAQLLRLGEHRGATAERKQHAERQAWRRERAALRGAVDDWRGAEQRCRDAWEAARQAFFSMQIGSGRFRAEKAAYEKAKRDAALQRAALQGEAQACRAAGRAFFAARAAWLQARRRQEKLALLDEELRRRTAGVEA